jgi:4-amino-4-deoxy-L-arabinose transferase-like glycosyltransferase
MTAVSTRELRTHALARPRADALVAGAVVALTLIGLAIRVANFGQSLLGDELSTYWIVHGHSLGHVLSSVRSNDEITPPLYFILGWASLKLGSSPEWLRLPSLVAGTATIPLIYLLGSRTVSRAAGLVAAAVMALSPFMIYYSTEARSYALMILLLTCSTLALLAALESGRARWWVIYAICSCGALYSHYTSLFPLAAQFAWVVWAHREALRALLLANVGVLIGFAPWIPGFIADNNSPSTNILSALQPFTFHAVRLAMENWAIGYPYVTAGAVPGTAALRLIEGGLLLALVAGAVRAWRWARRSRVQPRAALRRIPPGIVLVALLALATPVGEAIYSAVGTNLLGARNLNASWPGLAIAFGAVVTAAGWPVVVACAALVLTGFGIGAAKTLQAEFARSDFAALANVIQERWEPGDVVVDGAPFTPVPLTGLDTYLPQTHREIRLGLPQVDHPFTPLDPRPSVPAQIDRAIKEARGHSLFLVSYLPRNSSLSTASGLTQKRKLGYSAQRVLNRLPPSFEVRSWERFPGLSPLALVTIESRGRHG